MAGIVVWRGKIWVGGSKGWPGGCKGGLLCQVGWRVADRQASGGEVSSRGLRHWWGLCSKHTLIMPHVTPPVKGDGLLRFTGSSMNTSGKGCDSQCH